VRRTRSGRMVSLEVWGRGAWCVVVMDSKEVDVIALDECDDMRDAVATFRRAR
jgi:hypothetical protein